MPLVTTHGGAEDTVMSPQGTDTMITRFLPFEAAQKPIDDLRTVSPPRLFQASASCGTKPRLPCGDASIRCPSDMLDKIGVSLFTRGLSSSGRYCDRERRVGLMVNAGRNR